MDALTFLTGGLFLATLGLAYQTWALVKATQKLGQIEYEKEKRARLEELISPTWKIQEVDVGGAGLLMGQKKLPEPLTSYMRRLELFKPYLGDSITEQYLVEILLALRTVEGRGSIGDNRDNFVRNLQHLKDRLYGQQSHLLKWQKELMKIQPM